jgi:FtsP/CotA-like multicopper oxidase with cupredoxin domain
VGVFETRDATVNFNLSRRNFVKGFCATTGIAALSQDVRGQSATAKAFEINVTTRQLDVNGKAAKVYSLATNGSTKGLYTRYGVPFRAQVSNSLGEQTLIHWHGLTPPSGMDGVPMLSGPVLQPSETREFAFVNRRTGTHWMHSHVGLQEQNMLAAPLIVAEDGAALVDEQEHVIMLHDFTFRDPNEILEELKSGKGGHAAHTKMAGMDHSKMKMPAMPGMLNDVNFDAMLANDRTISDPEIVRAEKRGRLRLRIINGAAATNFWIDLGSLQGEIIAVDGNAVYPIKAQRFPLAIAQRADIRLTLPQGSGAWPVLFQVEGSTQQSSIILQSGDGHVAKVIEATAAAAMLDLTMEAQLRPVAIGKQDPVARTEIIMLTGGGADYLWGLNGKPSMHDVLFNVRQGERYEIMMHNMTGMAHPMHLHGHYFNVVAINGRRFPGALRDTVLVPPDAQVTIQFDADNPGTWAFHCHHLYHMNSGMMAAIAYQSAA